MPQENSDAYDEGLKNQPVKKDLFGFRAHTLNEHFHKPGN